MPSYVGNGATFAITNDSVTIGTIISIDPGEETIDDIPDDSLGTEDYHELIPGQAAAIGKMTLRCIFNADSVPSLGTVGTGTLTFPPGAGQSSGATYAGSGYLSRRKITALELDTRIELELDWQFDGKTGPAHTQGSS